MTSASLRTQLLGLADLRVAAELAGVASDQVNEHLNAIGVSMATSLVARALIARAVIGTAAAWWADRGLAEPETYAVIKSIVDDLPSELVPVCFIDPTIVEERG